MCVCEKCRKGREGAGDVDVRYFLLRSAGKWEGTETGSQLKGKVRVLFSFLRPRV